MGLFDKLFAGGAKGVIDSVGGVLDNLITNKEELAAAKLKAEQEINRHFEVLSTQAAESEKLYLADVANSRDANVKIQDNANASWMSKNIAYLIDIFITLTWVALTSYLIIVMLNLVKKDDHVDYTAVTAVWGAVTGVFTQVLSFHRGSSKGSEDKQRMIEKLTK